MLNTIPDTEVKIRKCSKTFQIEGMLLKQIKIKIVIIYGITQMVECSVKCNSGLYDQPLTPPHLPLTIESMYRACGLLDTCCETY